MKRKKYKDYLWYTALAVFILCVLEGIMYYHDTENWFLKISLNIQNVIKAYKIDPDIKQKEAIAFLEQSGGGIWRTMITYLYCVAVIVAPFCTISALTILLFKPANYLHGLLKRQRAHRVLIIGEGTDQKNFVDALSKDCFLTVVEEHAITEEKKTYYLNHGIKFIQKYSDMAMYTILNSLNLSKFESFLLCDEDVLKNIEYLKLILEYEQGRKGFLKKPDHDTYPQIYIHSNDAGMSELIRQYYDHQENKKYEINIINVHQMAVNKMLLEYPVYLGNDKEHRDVHIGIIGFGEFGQNTLLQSLNMSVLSADSHICVDVFDVRMNEIIGTFMKHFSVEMLDRLQLIEEELFEGKQVSYYQLVLSPDTVEKDFSMDGKVTLRFWEADVQTLHFSKLFTKCNNDEIPFTYLVIAMGNTHSMADAILDMKRILYRKEKEKIRIPVIIRTRNKENVVEIYQEENLFEISQNKDVYSYASLTSQDILKEAKVFNHRYNVLYEVISSYKESKMTVDDAFMLKIEQILTEEQKHIETDGEKLDKAWHGMKIFDRESSIAQAMHQNVKRWLMEQGAYLLTEDKEELEKLEHRRWTLFMITQGFRYEKGERKDLTAKTHPCLLNWKCLKQEKPETLEYDFTPYYILRAERNGKIQ